MMRLNNKDAKSKTLVGRWQLNEGKGKVALDSSAVKKPSTGLFVGGLTWTDDCKVKTVVKNNTKPATPEGVKISTGLMVYHYPLTDCSMEVKTVPFNANALKNFGKLKAAMKKPSPKGYCDKAVQHMNYVSNRKLCGGNQARNVGYYFRTTFPVANDGTMYYFRTPTDFGRGGVVVLDGKVMIQEKSDIWQGGKSTKLDFTAKLS